MTKHRSTNGPADPHGDDLIGDRSGPDRERTSREDETLQKAAQRIEFRLKNATARRWLLTAFGISVGGIAIISATLILSRKFDSSPDSVSFFAGVASSIGISALMAVWHFASLRKTELRAAEERRRGFDHAVLGDALLPLAHDGHRNSANHGFLEAWQRYEAALRSVDVLDPTRGGADIGLLPIGELLPLLLSSGAIGPDDYAQVLVLLELRNNILHGGEFSQEDVHAGIIKMIRLRSMLPRSGNNAEGRGITAGVTVRVTGVSSTERGAEGIVKTVRQGWAGKEAVVVVPGALRSREFTIPVTELSTGPENRSTPRSTPQAVEGPSH